MESRFVFSERWWDLRGRAIEDVERRESLERELVREVAHDHVLHDVQAVALAACSHCDDVLFATPPAGYAVVHLSYPGRGPDRAPGPRTLVFAEWKAVVDYLDAHDEE